MAVAEVGARLTLRGRQEFTRGVRAASDEVERLDDRARRADRGLGGLGGALGRMARSGLGGIAGLARSAATGLAALTVSVVAGGIGLIQMASDAQETESRFRTIFGSMSRDVDEWITGVQGSVYIATAELQNAAATFGSFGQAVGVPQSDLASFSTALAQAGLDLSSFNNEDPATVFDALRSGLSGEAEPLRRFGIFLSEAALAQFALNEGISESVSEMSEQEKVLLRQQFILANLGAAQGDLDRTAGGFANRWRGLVGTLRDLGVRIGEALLPVAEDLMPSIQSAVEQFSGWVGRNQGAIRDWFSDAADSVRGFWKDRIIPAWNWIIENWPAIAATFGDVFDAIAVGFRGVATVINKAWTMMQTVTRNLLTAWQNLGNVFAQMPGGIGTAGQRMALQAGIALAAIEGDRAAAVALALGGSAPAPTPVAPPAGPKPGLPVAPPAGPKPGLPAGVQRGGGRGDTRSVVINIAVPHGTTRSQAEFLTSTVDRELAKAKVFG